VDRSDQALGYYKVCCTFTHYVKIRSQRHRQFKKWHLQVILYLLNLAKVNTWTIIERNRLPDSTKRFDLLDFQWYSCPPTLVLT
jgi:hypothetical protein